MKHLGIIGGGQLALMGAEAAMDLGVPISVLCQSESDPCFLKFSEHCFLPSQVDEFLAQIDVLTFESEFFEEKLVHEMRSKNPELECVPDLESMLLLRNKLNQKHLFDQCGLRHARYLQLEDDCEKQLREMMQNEELLVIKWAQGGYDGKGNFFLRSEAEIADALSFVQAAHSKKVEVYAEAGVPFTSECASICFRSPKGKLTRFPIVHTYQEQGICKEVSGPMLEEEIESQVDLAFRKVSEAKPGLQLFALEFFIDEERKVHINELAPRVHNTAHYSQLGGRCSQFHNWIRICVGDDAVEWGEKRPFVMRNLLGRSSGTRVLRESETQSFPDLKWYQKLEKKGRKLGHWNRWVKPEESTAQVLSGIEEEEESFFELTRKLDQGKDGE